MAATLGMTAWACAILASPLTARADGIVDEYGVSYNLGGGFVQFAHGAMREHADEGWGWETRVAFGTRKPFAVELGYLGSLHDLDASGLDSRANLLGVGLDGLLRIPFASGPLQPYLLFGAGWRRYEIIHTLASTREMRTSDTIASYPLGGGIVVTYGEYLFDFRAVYRMASHVDLLPSPEARLDAWSATLTIGVEL